MTVLTKTQVKTYGPRFYTENGTRYRITANVRYDDSCGNGHNTFSITADIYENARNNRWIESSFGCQHEEVAKHFPELADYTRWHLVSSDGPLHYIANTTYHAQQGNLDYARSSAMWPDATLEQLQDVDALKARLPQLLKEFQAAVESLGLVY